MVCWNDGRCGGRTWCRTFELAFCGALVHGNTLGQLGTTSLLLVKSMALVHDVNVGGKKNGCNERVALRSAICQKASRRRPWSAASAADT